MNPEPCSRRLGVTAHNARGYALVELLVATAIASVVLGGAYGWVWSVGALARAQDDRAQASTIAAVATRTIAGDIRAAVAVVAPSAGADPARSLTLAHDRVDVAPSSVVFVWDPVRRVLWRNASGTYVADHVTAFRVDYVLDDGRCVDGRSMTTADWASVRVVRVTLTTQVEAACVERTMQVSLGNV